MSDDSETDTKQSILAEVTDDSCTAQFIEIVPLDRPSDDYRTSEFIDPVVEVKPEDLQEMKQEPADENDNGASQCCVKQEADDENDISDSHCYVKHQSHDNYRSPEFIYPVVEVKPEDLQEMKQEPPDEYGIVGSSLQYSKVHSCLFVVCFYIMKSIHLVR